MGAVVPAVTRGLNNLCCTCWRFSSRHRDLRDLFECFTLQVIKANSDRNTVADHVLQPPITARYIKLLPKEFYGKPSMRMELYTGQCSGKVLLEYYFTI